MRAGTRRNVGARHAKRRCALQPGVSLPGCEKRRPRRARGGVTGTVAASLLLTLRQPGMETRCPEGAGQRQRSWLGAQHDSPGSRQGSRP
ncbi:hypothetical protein L7B86_002508 [Salmonella enterica]|nr:hypothetical protein [Salmonella enterica]EIV0939400.1 hypothetical protein [Salmonella enterica]EME8396399.1 hypothetical protein [Salmonella enterica]